MNPPLPESFQHPPTGRTASDRDPITRYTFCDGCNQVPKCGIVYRREGSVITHVRSRRDFDYPANTLCAKGYAQLQEHYHPDRLKFPLKRTAPKGEPARWERISWDEALTLTAQKLSEIKRAHGADKVCFFTGDPKEMRAPLQRLSYCFGSPNYGTESSTCFTSIAMAGKLLLGQTIMGNPPSQATRHCFIWGSNPAYSRPVSMKGLLKSKMKGVKFFVVDPRKTPTVKTLAATHLAPRPGTDGLLALGMVSYLMRNGLHDKEFVTRWVHNFEALEGYLQELSLARVSSLTRVPVETIQEAALAFANGPATVMLSAACVVHHTNGNQNVRALLTLVAITGNLDCKGGVIIPAPPLLAPDTIGDPSFCRRNDLLPQIRHLRADADDFPVWAELVDEIQMNKLPEYVDRGKLRGIVMFGGNVKMWPQPRVYQSALAKLDFAVATDLFYRPWTHDYVDLLLPAATCFERIAPVACFGNSIYARQPMKPLGEAREDWQIIAALGVALGFGEEFYDGNVEALVDEALKPAGVTLAEIKGAPGCMVKIGSPDPAVFGKHESGLLRKDRKPGFATPTGKIEVYSSILERHGLDPLPSYREPKESPESDPRMARKYPLVLMTGARVPFYTHSKWRNVPWLSEFQPGPVVNLSPVDAENRKIRQGDLVIVENRHGSIRAHAHITDASLPGIVDVLHGWPDQDVNTMIPREFDPISGFPPYKAGLCEVRKDNS